MKKLVELTSSLAAIGFGMASIIGFALRYDNAMLLLIICWLFIALSSILKYEREHAK